MTMTSLRAALRVHLQYARYIYRHKLFVFRAARELGVPWLGLLHDLSKLLPDEWGPYATNFYAYPRGAEKPQAVKDAFDRAWLYHQRRNKHHWQAWVAPQDDGGTNVLPMPDRYRREMLADWIGAGRAIPGAPPFREWYAKSKPHRKLHPDTMAWVEATLTERGLLP